MEIQLKAFQNVAANSTASLSTQELNGYSVHALRFVLGGGNTKANITRLQVRVNKKSIIDHITGTQYQNINTWKNAGNVATDLAFFFGNPDAVTYRGQHLTDLDLSNIKDPSGAAASLEIQADLGAGVAPTLSCFAEVGPGKALTGQFSPNEYATTKAYIRTLLTPAAALALQQQDIGFGSHAGAGILNEFWFHANMTSLQVKKSGLVIWDNIAIAQMNDWQLDYNHPTVAGMYVWSPTYRKFYEELETTITPDGKTPYPFQHLLTTSAADTINVFTEVATNLNLI